MTVLRVTEASKQAVEGLRAHTHGFLVTGNGVERATRTRNEPQLAGGLVVRTSGLVIPLEGATRPRLEELAEIAGNAVRLAELIEREQFEPVAGIPVLDAPGYRAHVVQVGAVLHGSGQLDLSGFEQSELVRAAIERAALRITDFSE